MFKKLMLIVCTGLLCCGCTAREDVTQKFSETIFAMDTVMNLTVFDRNDDGIKEAEDLIHDLEKKLSTTDPNSEIYTLNHTGSAVLSRPTAELLTEALGYCRETDGALDLSIYPVVRAWGFTTGSYQVPSQEALDILLEQVDYRKISFSKETSTVSVPEGMQIDLGSVGKGYTGDRIIQLLRSRGVTSALLNLGGNIQALGRKPDGTLWKIGLQDPRGEGNVGILSLDNQAVITSGGYERFFRGDDGTVYWHIIDPSTGRPAKNGLISATAVGPKGSYCDALSTSLFIMGPEKAVEFWKAHQDFDMILITEDGEVLITPNLTESFLLTETASYRLREIGHD